MPRYRILLTKTERSEMDIVAANSEDAQRYAVIGANKSNEKKQAPEFSTTILRLITEDYDHHKRN